MSTDQEPAKRIVSFKHAIDGILIALKEEPNLKIHFLIASIVIIAGFYFGITKPEWIIIALLIGLIFSIELINTSIEEIVDAFTKAHHPGAKKAKDVAAGAVLIATITSIIVGIMIFLPYLLRLFNFWG